MEGEATWARLSKLLDEVLELAPDARMPWIDRLTGADAALAPRLRSLLARAAADDAEFLRTLPGIELAAAGSDPSEDEGVTAGALVGGYRTSRVIGEGGMGAVWLAERADGVIKRQVALKVPRQLGFGPGFRARLERERDILAALTHPNIARLYDAGTTDAGQPFLALELVDGEPIDTFAAARHLDVEARLRLFVQVARAVAYAHRNLVIHRDLKPSNILVTRDGQVKLLDFGIARLLDEGPARESALTELWGRLLTPEFASPEQLAGEPLSIGSDVYSLGVVLFRLLTGAGPYGAAHGSRAALEQAVRSGPRIRPSAAVAEPALSRQLQGDVDTIVLKALKTSPDERYATADAFADDVERHLAGLPVLARPDTAWYRTSKFVRRHAWPVALAAAAVVTVMTAAGVALWQAHVARSEQRRAEEVKEFIAGIFRNANLDAADNRTMTVRELLVQAHDRVARLDAAPSVRVELLNLLGTSLLSLGDTDALEQVATRAAGESEQRLAADDPLAIESRLLLVWTHMYRGRTAQMRAELDRVMATMEREPRRFSRQLVTAWRLRADVAIDSGRHEEAERAAREALARAQAVHGARGQETLLAMRLLAEALRRNGKIDEAVSAAEQAFHVTVEAYAERPLHPDLVQARGMYGRTLCDAGRMAEGLTQLSRAVEEAATLFGKESRSVGFLLQQLSGYQLRVGRILEALDSGSRAARIAATHAEPGSFTLAATLNNQARALLAARRGGEAVPLFDQVIAAAAKIFGATHPNTLAARADRALALAYAGNISDAARDIDLVTADMRKAGKPSARVLYAAGVIAPLAGAAPRALPLLGEARSILAGDRNARAELGQVEAQIGGIQAGREPGESEASLTAALALFKEVYQVDTPSQADANLALGRLRLAAGRAVEALPLLEQAGRFWDRFAPESRWAADASDTLARCYARLGRTADAHLATARSRAVSARLDK